MSERVDYFAWLTRRNGSRVIHWARTPEAAARWARRLMAHPDASGSQEPVSWVVEKVTRHTEVVAASGVPA